CVGEIWICLPGKSCLADERAGCVERLDFAALGEERIGKSCGVGADGDLMSAVPVSRRGDHVDGGLQTATALVETLEIIAGGTVDEQHVGLRAFRDEVERAVIGGGTEIEKGVGKPDLVFERCEVALLVEGDGGGDWIEGVEADVCAV